MILDGFSLTLYKLPIQISILLSKGIFVIKEPTSRLFMRQLEECLWLIISLERWIEWMKLYLFDVKIGSKIFATLCRRVLIVYKIQWECLILFLVLLCISPSLCNMLGLGPTGSSSYCFFLWPHLSILCFIFE